MVFISQPLQLVVLARILECDWGSILRILDNGDNVRHCIEAQPLQNLDSAWKKQECTSEGKFDIEKIGEGGYISNTI